MDRFVNNKINFNLIPEFRFGDAAFKISLTYPEEVLPKLEFLK